MFRIRKVTPALVAITTFAVLTAAGLVTLFLTRDARQGAAPADPTPTTVPRAHLPGGDPDVPPSQGPGPSTSEPGPGPDTPGVGDPGTPGGGPSDPATGPDTPDGLDPDQQEPVEYSDPGPNPLPAPAALQLQGAFGYPGGATWIHHGAADIDAVVAHYMGELNSGSWTFSGASPVYLTANPNGAPPAAWRLEASNDSADAVVTVFGDDWGGIGAQVELTYR